MNSKKDELLKDQEKLCEEKLMDFEQVKDLNSKIIALLQEEIVAKQLTVPIKNTVRSMSYLDDIADLFISGKTSPKQETLLTLFLYLSVAEGVFSSTVENIAFLLMQNGHDIYNPENREFAGSFEELDKIDLFIKVKFLEKHGFQFLTTAFDRKFRNCIAHLDFAVDDEGKLTNTRTGEEIKDAEQKLLTLLCTCSLTTDALAIAIDTLNQNEKEKDTPS
jgi:hypothetical protein